MLAVQKQPGTNVIAVVDGIRKQLPAIIAQMPAGIELEVSFDRSKTIRESVEDVKFTLLLAIGLVMLVIFIFLRNPSRRRSFPAWPFPWRCWARSSRCTSAATRWTICRCWR